MWAMKEKVVQILDDGVEIKGRMAEVTCWDMPLLEEIVAAKQRIREENPLWVWAHETYWDRFAG